MVVITDSELYLVPSAALPLLLLLVEVSNPSTLLPTTPISLPLPTPAAVKPLTLPCRVPVAPKSRSLLEPPVVPASKIAVDGL